MVLSHLGEDFAGRTCSTGCYIFIALADAFALVGEGGDVEEALVGFGGEDLLRCKNGIEAGGAELVGEGVRDVEGHLHGVRVAPCAV
jgi:hypothetical protein